MCSATCASAHLHRCSTNTTAGLVGTGVHKPDCSVGSPCREFRVQVETTVHRVLLGLAHSQCKTWVVTDCILASQLF